MKSKKQAPKQQPKQKEQEKKSWLKRLKTWHWAVIITLAFSVLLVGSVGIWWACMDVESFSEGWTLVRNLFDEPENDVHYKDSYTVSDKKVQKWGDKVVATVGSKELTNSMLQVYYWTNILDSLSNSSVTQYLMAQGLDFSLPLDEQYYEEFGGTFEQYFIEEALRTWHNYQAMAILSEKAGLEMTAAMKKDLTDLRTNLAQSAASGGYTGIDAMLRHDMGAGCTYEAYRSYLEIYYGGYLHFESEYNKASEAITDEVLEEYFTNNEELLKENDITKDSGDCYDVRHILIAVEGGTKGEDGKLVYSEEEWQECQEEAQKLLDEWLAGEATEETFAVLANQNSADSGSNSNGGLYSGLTEESNYVDEFKQWYLDSSRKTGDTGLIKTEYGYHVMYFVKGEPQWKAVAREQILADVVEEIVGAARERYPITVEYEKIVLGHVDLTDM